MSSLPRIGVDMAATAGRKSGLGFYLDQVVTHMEEAQTHEIVRIEKVKRDLNTPRRLYWDQVGLPLAAAGKQLDALFVGAFSAPRFSKPIVMTAHDIYGVRFPDQFSGLAKYYWNTVLPQSMKHANHLVCVSEYTKNDIATHLSIPEERMTAIPLAAAPHFRILNDVERIKQRLHVLGVRPPYVLSVGTIEPRKNYTRLLEAFAFAQRDGVQLVLVGKKGWQYEEVFRAIRKYRLEESVVWLDYISDEDLVMLYNACELFVMPSLFEGFGLPALEAMQCGAPVLVSQNTSLPEVVGHAGVLFDPTEPDSIRERMELVLSDSSLRREMQIRSIERAAEFSWQRTATETLSIIDSVIS